MSITHYAVIVFSGDPLGEHPNLDLRGRGPNLTLIGAGDEDYCWSALSRWTLSNELREWETAEVLERTTR